VDRNFFFSKSQSVAFEKKTLKRENMASAERTIIVNGEPINYYVQLAVWIGNIIEFYDFSIYASLADVIGDNFFPSSNNSMSLIKSLAVFGSAMLCRPIGGLLLGTIGDLTGRKRALEVSILMMLLPSFMIGILPTYHMIGYPATVILVLMRLLQGVAVGGEVIGAFIITVESSKSNKSLLGSLCKASTCFGSAIGMIVCLLIRELLPRSHFERYGWRIPFLLSAVFALIGYYVRSNLQYNEIPNHYIDDDEVAVLQSTNPIASFNRLPISSPNMSIIIGSQKLVPFVDIETKPTTAKDIIIRGLRRHWRDVLLVIAVSSFWIVCYYTCFIWIQYYLSVFTSTSHTWVITVLMMLLLVICIPIAGYSADILNKYHYESTDAGMGNVLLMKISIVIMLALVVPAFGLMNTNTVKGAVLAQLIFTVSLALYGATLPSFIVHRFTKTMRYTILGISYNISNAIFAGTISVIQLSLVLSGDHQATGTSLTDFVITSSMLKNDGRYRPCYYVMAIGVFAMLSLLYWLPHCNDMRYNRHKLRSIEDALDAFDI
jgi:MHS family proline/betaine transporter-like MFS transporter